MPKRSAGLLLYRLTGAVPEVLLVHPGGPLWARKDLGAWSIPKGEYVPGEDPIERAVTEFEEELGLPAPVARDDLVGLGEVRQKGGKVVVTWAANADFDETAIESMTFPLEWPPRSGRVQEFAEVDRAAWFSLADARRRLVAAQAELIDRLEAHIGNQVFPGDPR
jgi:predicted NUDIX family NTP pyrophosphohydrolase